MEVLLGPDRFFSSWLYDEHLTFAKFRVTVDDVFDVNFESRWAQRIESRVVHPSP